MSAAFSQDYMNGLFRSQFAKTDYGNIENKRERDLLRDLFKNTFKFPQCVLKINFSRRPFDRAGGRFTPPPFHYKFLSVTGKMMEEGAETIKERNKIVQDIQAEFNQRNRPVHNYPDSSDSSDSESGEETSLITTNLSRQQATNTTEVNIQQLSRKTPNRQDCHDDSDSESDQQTPLCKKQKTLGKVDKPSPTATATLVDSDLYESDSGKATTSKSIITITKLSGTVIIKDHVRVEIF